MNKKLLIASTAASVAMLIATPAFADSNKSHKGDHHGFALGSIVRLFDGHGTGDHKKDKDGRWNKHATSTNPQVKTGIVGTVTAVNGTTIMVLGRDNVSYTVTAANAAFTGKGDVTVTAADVRVGDYVSVRGTVSGTLVTASKVSDAAIHARTFLNAIGAAGAGVVTSVNGSTFTIASAGKSGTTTVTTNASTVYRVNGNATSTNALVVGSKVLLIGTTTSDTSITASLVSIFSKGFGFFKHMFHK